MCPTVLSDRYKFKIIIYQQKQRKPKQREHTWQTVKVLCGERKMSRNFTNKGGKRRD